MSNILKTYKSAVDGKPVSLKISNVGGCNYVAFIAVGHDVHLQAHAQIEFSIYCPFTEKAVLEHFSNFHNHTQLSGVCTKEVFRACIKEDCAKKGIIVV